MQDSVSIDILLHVSNIIHWYMQSLRKQVSRKWSTLPEEIENTFSAYEKSRNEHSATPLSRDV